ncbi:MAG: xanthine dehydrogenase family protein subunit M [Alphaproteobacteria bacterium]|nr:xanthine dehydrogenase family protein subunit M [Alphaproteobacteria bacterium]
MTAYARPADLETALALLSDGARRVLAGGTDLYPGAGAQLDGPVLDITALPALKGVTLKQGLRIGAATTWAEIAAADLPPALQGLQQAARQIGARQVQNVGSIGGNLCNASPAADGVPPLLTLDAEVELCTRDGGRTLPLDKFILGPRKTALAPGEILVAVHVPATALAGRGAFLKLGARAYLVISIAMASARVVVSQGIVTDAAIAVGAASPVARRLTQLERALIGAPVGTLADQVTAETISTALDPIDDVRATAGYRAEAAAELVQRLLRGLA